MHQRTKIAIAVAMALNTLTAFAQAQAEAEAPQRVEITGSRIRQVDLETAQPVQKITAQQIQATGLITVGDILNQMTSAGTPAFSKGAVLTSNREQGGQYIDMRNLGANRLLVLVNGKRWTQSVDGYTDMSTVPASMIERIDILKDGASSIYGSDAIAGVVNIILKKRLEGGAVSVYKGVNQKGDGKTSDYSLSYGANSEKASMMFGLSHSQTDPVWASKRDITSQSYGTGDFFGAGFGAGPWGRITPISSIGVSNPAGFNRYLNHTGSFDGSGVGADARNPANYHAYTGAQADTYNSTQQMMFTAPTKLTTIFTKGTIELPMDMRFTTTAMYSERNSSRQVAGYPLNSASQPNYRVFIDKDSYFNPYGNQVAGAGQGQDLYFARRMVEVPRVTDNSNQTLHVDATLEGEFTLRGLPWSWSAGYNHSSLQGTNVSTGNLNLLNLKKALGPSFLNANGVVQCGTAASPIAFSQCTPFNILGGPSASNPDAIAYVMSTGQGTYGSTINSATADLSGELFTLPAGAVGFAGGVEHREVRGYDRPGQFEQSGYSTDLAANTTQGRYTVKEIYLEANIPLLKDQPFAKFLSVDLASRYSDYSNFGSTTNSKASLMWKPVTDLLVRGTWAQGFRAPALGDTFGGGSQSFDSYLDPCDSRYGLAARNPAVAQRCAATGVPAGYRQLNQSSVAVGASGAQSAVPFNGGVGNDTLTPETAKTKTLGFVYNPSYVPGLTVGLDWFKINVQNQISGWTAAEVIGNCVTDNIQKYCGDVVRDATGAITGLSRGTINKGELSTEGFDISLGYRLPRTAYGNFAIRTESTVLRSFKQKASATSDWQEYAGEFTYARLKSNISLDWMMGNWAATLTGRYTSGVKDLCLEADIQCSNPDDEGVSYDGGGYNKRGSTTYVDLSVAYKTPWKGEIVVGSNNLFNRAPRLMYAATSLGVGTSSSSAVDPNAPIDRVFYVRYNQAF
ncbi:MULTISPECIES: TonB-dependent receptor domain-containing protein [unclassified Janthinobacterium]|uniref:TonB-dependent receptor domain-containing protein n=1 Tax=unclassified Janthinobacterium TaxID=2610881 RepID=UPI00161BE0C4|nr:MULTISPECIES: TonB-dependent receptor [unclassified Janthinobacterium]MBB5609973.1 iron complex outermembrane receptor protein [Janthinobacterium sp. S3T4]MBB5615007.1 iron complex outermembrane receptor protein [Janthinobacterium sp. S3M3]